MNIAQIRFVMTNIERSTAMAFSFLLLYPSSSSNEPSACFHMTQNLFIFLFMLKPHVHFCYTVYMIKKKLKQLDSWFFCSEVSNILTPFVVLTLFFTGMSYATS